MDDTRTVKSCRFQVDELSQNFADLFVILEGALQRSNAVAVSAAIRNGGHCNEIRCITTHETGATTGKINHDIACGHCYYSPGRYFLRSTMSACVLTKCAIVRSLRVYIGDYHVLKGIETLHAHLPVIAISKCCGALLSL